MAADVYHDLPISERGFALILALLLLVTLTLLGVLVTRTSVMENMIVTAERTHRETFTVADGGSQAGITLLEYNFACSNGFTGKPPITIGAAVVDPHATLADGTPLNNGQNFWLERVWGQINDQGVKRNRQSADMVSDANRFLCIQGQGVNDKAGNVSCLNPGAAGYNAALSHTNIFYNTGAAVASPGWSANMSGGGSGTGYQQSQGGASNYTQIASQHLGIQGSMSIVQVNWRHLIESNGNCPY